MDERGENNETTEEINIRHRRHRRGKKSKRTSNYDTQPEKASHKSENHSGGTSKTQSRGKLESIKTSTNDKVIEENHTSGEKDNEDAGVGKKRKGIKDKKQKDSRNKKSDNYDWDYMKVTRKAEHSDVQNGCIWKKLQAFAKVIFIAFTSIFVLATAVISKLCLISITSNLLPPTNVTDSFMNVTDSFWWHKTAGSSFCFKNQQTNVQWIWALILVISAPYIFEVIGSGWQLLLRKQKRESEWEGFGKKMLRETLHSVGICMMAFVLLPSIDPIAGTLVCFHVATIPGLLEICHRFYNKFKTYLHRVFLAIALLLQVVGIALACAYYVLESKTEIRILQVITICFSPVLVSCSWWENYVPFLKNQTKIYPKVGSENHHGAQNVTNSVPENQSKTPGPRKNLIRYRSAQFNLLANLLKVTITVLVPIILFGVQCPNGSECIGTLFGVSLNSTFRNRVGISVLSSTKSFGDCTNYLPLTVAIVSIICSGACYYAAQIGCKILAKITCLSIPLTIASPTALGALFVILSRDVNVESCFLPFPLWGTDSSVLLNHIRSSNYGLIIASGICGYISLWIICYHIWIPEKRGLRKSDKLSAKPLYCGILTDQSIRLNIKRTDMDNDKSGENKEKVPSSTNPRIYLCATMWHESESEMKKLIESIIRLDKKNSLKRKSNEERRESLSNEDSFHFEAHIFFDDAFEMRKEDPGKGRIILNQYVENLINVMQEVHGNQPLKVRKSTTAYGGRLQWKLISGSVIYAHLKNKNIVRCKKRWSQVMYMYFILGHKEVHKQKDIEDKDDAHDMRRKERLENTFIMALDGDVDFKPEAIDYLIDRMRKNPMVGAACGRIHPTGSGPVVWYQKFEYAVSHWLQKVPEDVIGCVLCSPGCFSLFRGSALVADNVLKVYTSSPKKGWHHIQYDLGEDRWLCTLLLQAGFKIEYVAVSDAFTKAPEGFNEFFNQRRRWIPSTLANLLDLLIEWNHVVKKNPYICRMFLFYELCVMVSTILTPGTICLLIAGALTIAFPLLPLWVALLFTILPVAAFIIVCFKATSETQTITSSPESSYGMFLRKKKIGKGKACMERTIVMHIMLTFAAVLSMLYALVMMVVLVGLLVHMVKNGLCSITTMFFTYVGMVFLTTAVLHPKV